jgi:hypothetical protein
MRFNFLGTDGAAIVLGVFAVIEFFADKIPVVDHAVHVLHFAAKPIAAAILVGSMVPDGSTPDVATTGLMALGALNALGVHGGVAALRGASTATTAGLGNPILSIIEDVIAVVGVVVAFVAPFLGAALAVVLTIVALFCIRGIVIALRRSNSTVAPGPLT